MDTAGQSRPDVVRELEAHQQSYGRHRSGRPGLFRRPDVLHRVPAYVDLGGAALMTETRTAVLEPTGRLNMVAAPAFKNLVEETVASGQTRIVVDLGRVTFIDSSGLGGLISGLKATREAGGDLRIADVRDQVMTVLRLTDLDRVLRVHPTVADASRDW